MTIPPEAQPFFCGHHALLAHASAYRLAKSMGINGTISFKNNGGYKIPLTNSTDDALATQRAWDFNEGWFANPVFVNGDYPQSLKDHVSTLGLEFTNEQKSFINGTADIFAHDAYTSYFYFAPDVGVADCLANSSNPLYPGCYNSSKIGPTGWLIGAASDMYSPWLQRATDWVPAFLRYIQNTWPSGGIAISEFGWTEPYEELRTLKEDILSDYTRSAYFRSYLESVLIAISEGVNVVGCLAWSIMDNLEWTSGEFFVFSTNLPLTFFQAIMRSSGCSTSILRRMREITKPHSSSMSIPSSCMLKIL